MYVRKHIGIAQLFSRGWRVELGLALVVVATIVVHIEILDAYFQISLAVAALGTAISFFIGFFTSHAYDRWWEARKIWGELVNDSRSFGRMLATLLPGPEVAPELVPLRETLVRRHIAYLYAVKSRLRGEDLAEALTRLPEADLPEVDGAGHLPNRLLDLQGRDLDGAERGGHIDVIRLAQFNEMLSRFSSSMGAAERIKLTVFPPYYSSMIRLSIWAYVVVFAFALSEAMGYAAIPFVFVAGTVFHLVYEAGRLLVDPFENHPNDVPMSNIVRTIEIGLLEQIGEKELPPPVEPVDGTYLM